MGGNVNPGSMLFGEYLRGVRKLKGLKTSKEHFESLGGKTKLGISLRHFQQIESDKYPPSEKLLATLTSLMPKTERRGLLLSYFKSIYSTQVEGQEVVNYLDQHLMPDQEAMSQAPSSQSLEKTVVYSQRQLDYLSSNPKVFDFHRQLLNKEEISYEESGLSRHEIEMLFELKLIHFDQGMIRLPYRLVRSNDFTPEAASEIPQFYVSFVKRIDNSELS